MDLSPDAIRDFRKRLGLTQPQLAEMVGCTSQAVSYWERGTRHPRGLYATVLRRIMSEHS